MSASGAEWTRGLSTIAPVAFRLDIAHGRDPQFAMSRHRLERSFDDGCDRWSTIEAAPASELARHVQGYGWWKEATKSFDTRQELASADGTLIVNLGSPLEIVDACARTIRFEAGEGFVAGLAQGTSLSRSTGVMEGVHVRAPLRTLARLAGVPASELKDRAIPLSELTPLRTVGFAERVAAAGDPVERWEALDQLLQGRLATRDPTGPTAAWIADALAAGQSVEAVAKDLNWSRKTLAKHFFGDYGLHPRAFIGLIRFQRFVDALKARPSLPLALHAIEAGYADQAHLTRETVRHAKATPAALRRRLLPDGNGFRA